MDAASPILSSIGAKAKGEKTMLYFPGFPCSGFNESFAISPAFLPVFSGSNFDNTLEVAVLWPDASSVLNALKERYNEDSFSDFCIPVEVNIEISAVDLWNVPDVRSAFSNAAFIADPTTSTSSKS